MAGHLICYMASIGLVAFSIGYVEFIRPALMDYLATRSATETAQPKEDKI
jgi:hypothetical protein